MSNDFVEMNKNVIELNASLNREITAICDPLFSQLGMSYFTYNRFIEGSTYFTIGNRVDWYKKLYNQSDKLDRHFFCHNVKTMDKQTKLVWDLEASNDFVKELQQNEIAHGLSIYRPKENYLEGWHFAVPREKSGINSLYMNDLPLLERFIHYFEQNALHLISLGLDERNHATFQDGVNFSLPQNGTESIDLAQDFKSKLSVRKHEVPLGDRRVRVTDKQARCVYFLSKGMTVKEVAVTLGLSPRTVGQYIDAVKLKTGIFNRSEMVKFFRNSGISNWYDSAS